MSNPRPDIRVGAQDNNKPKKKQSKNAKRKAKLQQTPIEVTEFITEQKKSN